MLRNAVNQFCGLNPGDPAQCVFYQAVSTAMKQQAATDGVSMLVGLGNSKGASNVWPSEVAGLTNNGAKLVNFVSYHQYLAGAEVSHATTWDGAGRTASLVRAFSLQC